TTTRAGRSAGRAGKAVRWAAGVGAAEVSAVVAPPAGVRSVARSDDTCGPLGVVGTEPVALGVGDGHRGGRAVLGASPGRGVGQRPLDVRPAVDGVLLVAGAEVEDLGLAAAEHGAGAEHPSVAEVR